MKKSFKKAGAAVLSMAMLLSMGAISMPVYAVDPPASGVYATNAPASVTVKVQGLSNNMYYQGEGQKYEEDENGDGSDSAAAANGASGDKYDYLDLTDEGLEGAKVTMYRLAKLTPEAGWQWEDYIREYMANPSSEVLTDFTDFEKLMKNKDGTSPDSDKSGITHDFEFNTPSETLQHMASYFERIIESLKTEKAQLESAGVDPDTDPATTQSTRLKNINKYLSDVTIASKTFGDADARGTGVTLPVTDVNQLDINNNGVLEGSEAALTQNVIGYYIIVTETENSGAVVQPVLICLKNGENKYVAVKGSEIEFEKTMTKIESQDETDSEDKNVIKDNTDTDRFSSTAGTDLKNGLVAKNDIVHYQIAAQLPKYDANVRGKDITPFVITDTASDGITFDIPVSADNVIDPEKFEVFLVDNKSDVVNGELAEGKGWKLTGSTVENVGDYQLIKDADGHGFTLKITGYQMQERDNFVNVASGSGAGATTRGDAVADDKIDDVNLLDIGSSSTALTGNTAGSLSKATRNTAANNFENKDNMENKFIYINYQATVDKNANGQEVSAANESKSKAEGGYAFDRSFEEYYNLEDVTSAEYADAYLAYEGLTGDDVTADVNKQILRVKLFSGETRYNQTYDAEDYSDTTFRTYFMAEGKTDKDPTDTANLNDKGKKLKTALGDTAWAALFDVYTPATGDTPTQDKSLAKVVSGAPVVATDNINNRIKLLLAKDKFNITRNGEYNTAKMTYGNRYATGGGQAQMNTNYSKVYSVDLELSKWIEVLNLEGTPIIQAYDVSYGKYAEPYARNENPKTITLDKATADGEGKVTFTLAAYKTAAAKDEADRSAEEKVIVNAVDAYVDGFTMPTVGTASADNGTGVDRVTGESITPAGDGTPVKDTSASTVWSGLTDDQKKLVAKMISDENRNVNDQYKTVYDKQAVVGAIFHLVRNYEDDAETEKTVDLGYAVSTPSGDLQKLTIAQGPQEEAITELPNNLPANTKGYIFKTEDGKYCVGYVPVTYTTDPIDGSQKIESFNGDKTWRMLDVGEYTIYELDVPTGYKKWDSATFTIGADKEDHTSPDYLQADAFLGSYNATGTIANTNDATTSHGLGSIEETRNGDTVEFAYNPATGTLSHELYNEYLDQLPATGGMGTVLFTAGGIAVILMAGALFVVYMKKRNAEEEE